jgi:aminopeptidase N
MVNNKNFTKADTLRGSVTEFRKGWDVLKYNLTVQVDIANKSISGSNEIIYKETLPLKQMQLDLQKPLVIDSIKDQNGAGLNYQNDGNVWLVKLKAEDATVKSSAGARRIKIFYHGVPKEAVRAPWDGGVVWKRDSIGNPFVAVACEGIGASVWWPCKDHLSDEPDEGMTITVVAPDTLSAISNGRLKNVSVVNHGFKTWTWEVKNPINNYNVTMNIGKYVNWNDTLNGEKGKLDLEYWVLQYNLDKAKKQFQQVKPMLRSFEDWFGPYPFYEDSYKLVETPFLGMEHQSAIAYGNGYQNGYRGLDLSGSGWGKNWDFIIVHESGHEWFGNNITAKDIADMWIHEGFTNYSETLYINTRFGKKAATEYCYGIRKNIKNDIPIIGKYGVNEEGSGDMYYKGANMLHLIRNTINDDKKFREILRGLNYDFYHQTVTTQQVEEYISKQSSFNFKPVFDQYLRSTEIPVLEYFFATNRRRISYRWTNCINDFILPIKVNRHTTLKPSYKWQTTPLKADKFDVSAIQKDYYIQLKEVTAR